MQNNPCKAVTPSIDSLSEVKFQEYSVTQTGWKRVASPHYFRPNHQILFLVAIPGQSQRLSS